MFTRRPLCTFAMILIVVIASVHWLLYEASVDSDSKEKVTVAGICKEFSPEKNIMSLYNDKGGNLIFIPKNTKFKKEPVGRRIEVLGYRCLPSGARNPGTFNYRLYLKYKGIDHIIYGESLKVGHVKHSFYHKIHLIKSNFQKDLIKYTEKKKAFLICALIYGEKDNLDPKIYEEFQKMGTAHILAASGIHMSILYAFFLFFAGKNKSIKINAVIGILIFLYMLLAGFSPSIVRAGITIYIYMFGKLLHRPADPETSLCLASSIILILNPYSLFFIGFQFSFLAVLILIRTAHLFKFFPCSDLAKFALLPMACLQILLLPFTVYHFNFFSPLSLAANTVVIFIGGIILKSGFLCLAYKIFFLTVPEFFFSFLNYFCDLLLTANNIFYMDGSFTFTVASPPVLYIFVFYALFWLFTQEEFIIWVIRKDIAKIIKYFSLMLILVVIFGKGFSTGFEDKNLIMLDVGQGEAILLKSPDGINILVDGGGSPFKDVANTLLKPALLKSGVSHIDFALCTHLDSDHFLAVKELSNQGFVHNFVTYEGNYSRKNQLARLLNLPPKSIIFAGKGRTIHFGKCTTASFLWPERKEIEDYDRELKTHEENSRGIVFNLYCQNTCLLVTGDIAFAQEESICSVPMRKNNKFNILQIPHHGSKYSSGKALLSARTWNMALIPVGKNHYGHPAKRVLKDLKKKNIPVYDTLSRGAVGISTSEPYMKPSTML